MAGPSHASLRFYAELNDHLDPAARFRSIDKEFFVPASVKDMIESCGVPHTEVDLVVVNGESSDFARLVRDGDRVAVYPVFEALDITPELRVRERALREPRFVLDVHLGRLARYLRMLGFDALYRADAADPELGLRPRDFVLPLAHALGSDWTQSRDPDWTQSCDRKGADFAVADLVRTSVEEQRILLTRDRGLLKHRAVTRGYWLRATESRRQTEEVVARFDLARLLRPFTRCMACNALLGEASQAEVGSRVPAGVAASHHEFRECPGCRRVYWQGTHYQRMRRWIDELAEVT